MYSGGGDQSLCFGARFVEFGLRERERGRGRIFNRHLLRGWGYKLCVWD